MAGLKYIKRDFVFYTNFDQEPVNPLKLMEGFVRETRERGDTAVNREATRLRRRTEVVRSPREGQ